MTLETSENLQNYSLPLEDFPADVESEIVTSYDEAAEIFRSPAFRTAMGDNSLEVVVTAQNDVRLATLGPPDPGEEVVPWEMLFRRGALLSSHGEEHTRRRRILNPLFFRDAHLWFRDTVIQPTLDRNIAQVLARRDTDGPTHVELVDFTKRIFVQMAAALVGFDGVDTVDGAEELIRLEAQMDQRRLASTLREGPELDAAMTRAFAARNAILDRFARPSMARREQLVARFRAGELSEEALPRDLLTLAASGTLPFEEAEGPLLMAMQLTPNATSSNTGALLNAFLDLAEWVASHPADAHLLVDGEFLSGGLREALRLHSAGSGVIPRVALQDVTLSTGRSFRAGQRIALVHNAIQQDPTVFGSDAHVFNPRRSLPPGVSTFGLAFGSGPHMCIGLPLVIGQGGITGMHVPTLLAYFAAGLRPDPQSPPQRKAFPFTGGFVRFPAIVEQTA